MEKKTALFILVLAGITLVFFLGTQSFVYAQGPGGTGTSGGSGGSGGTGGQQLPACPTDLTPAESGCSRWGAGSDADVTAAFGAAILACQNEMTTHCIPGQVKEMEKARAKCIVVPGCEFGYTVLTTNCGADSTTAADCTPPPGQDPPGTIYHCSVWGRVDYTGYTCARPVAPPPLPH